MLTLNQIRQYFVSFFENHYQVNTVVYADDFDFAANPDIIYRVVNIQPLDPATVNDSEILNRFKIVIGDIEDPDNMDSENEIWSDTLSIANDFISYFGNDDFEDFYIDKNIQINRFSEANTDRVAGVRFVFNVRQTRLNNPCTLPIINPFTGISFTGNISYTGGYYNLLEPYLKASDAVNEYQPKGNYLTGFTVDLSGYQPLGNYVSASTLSGYQVAGNYVSASTLSGYQPLGNYLTGITSNQVKTALGYTPLSAVTGYQVAGNYVSASTLSGYQPLGNYVSASTLSGYQLAGNYLTTISGVTVSAMTYAANSIAVNNTSGTSSPTAITYKEVGEAVYTGTVAWTGGVAPTGATNHVYNWRQMGKNVTVFIELSFASAGTSNTAVSMPLPPDCPTPYLPSNITNAGGSIICMGTGRIGSSVSGTGVNATNTMLRINAGGTGYEIFTVVNSAASAKIVWATIIYTSV